MQIMEGDIIRTIRSAKDYISHYHTAGNPGRNDLDEDQELAYPAILRAIKQTGHTGYVVHEFIPKGDPVMALKSTFKECAKHYKPSLDRRSHYARLGGWHPLSGLEDGPPFDSESAARLLRLGNRLCAGSVGFLFCSARLLFLRRLFVRGLRRFVTHGPKSKILNKRSQYGPAMFA